MIGHLEVNLGVAQILCVFGVDGVSLTYFENLNYPFCMCKSCLPLFGGIDYEKPPCPSNGLAVLALKKVTIQYSEGMIVRRPDSPEVQYETVSPT